MSKKLLAGLCVWAAVAVGWLAGLPGCDRGPQPPLGVQVVTTTGMIADVVARVAGERATVTSLMGPGIDPHLYKPSEGDVRRLSEADIILFNGLNLEGKMADILSRLASDRPVIAVAESLPRSELRYPAAFGGHPDPHVWFDVRLWSGVVEPIAKGLASVLPEHAEEFDASARRLREALLVLDAEVAGDIGDIPRERRVLVTAHDAFGYFGRRYDIDVVGLQGISTASEAGVDDVRRVVAVIVKRGVKAVFIESSVPRHSIEAVREACREAGHEVSLGGELFSDAMGAAGTEAGTYEGMVRHNVRRMVKALK